MIGACPLEELDFSHSLRLYPDALLHFLGREPLSLTPCILLRQVDERAARRLESLHGLVHLPANQRNEARPHTCCVIEILAAVEADDDLLAAMQW